MKSYNLYETLHLQNTFQTFSKLVPKLNGCLFYALFMKYRNLFIRILLTKVSCIRLPDPKNKINKEKDALKRIYITKREEKYYPIMFFKLGIPQVYTEKETKLFTMKGLKVSASCRNNYSSLLNVPFTNVSFIFLLLLSKSYIIDVNIK